MVSLTLGRSPQYRARIPGNLKLAVGSMLPTRRRPNSPAESSAITCSNPAARPSMASACSTKTLPASVRRVALPLRANNSTPKARSNCWTCSVTVDCA